MKTNIHNICDAEKLLKGAIQNYFLKIIDQFDNGIPETRKLAILSFSPKNFLQTKVKIDMAELKGYKLESFSKINFLKYEKQDGSTYAYFTPKSTEVLTYLKRASIISLRYIYRLETKKDMLAYLNKQLNIVPEDTSLLIENYYKNIFNTEKENSYNGKHML